jgi:hypothetical protein
MIDSYFVNARLPAIVDHEPMGGGEPFGKPFAVFESGGNPRLPRREDRAVAVA